MSWKEYALLTGIGGGVGALAGAGIAPEGHRGKGAVIGGSLGAGFGALGARGLVNELNAARAEHEGQVAQHWADHHDQAAKMQEKADQLLWQMQNKGAKGVGGPPAKYISKPQVIAKDELPEHLRKNASVEPSLKAFVDEIRFLKEAEEQEETPFRSKLPILLKTRAKSALKYGLGMGLGAGSGFLVGEKILPKLLPKILPASMRRPSEFATGVVGALMGGGASLAGLAKWEAMREAGRLETEALKKAGHD